MSARTDLLNSSYDKLIDELNDRRASADLTMRQGLKDLTKDELYDLGQQCGSEEGSGHCWRCKAWAMYLQVAE